MEQNENPFQIDESDLWSEWAQMSGRTFRAGQRVAEARHKLNQAKARLDVERARLFHQVRKSPANFDLPDGKSPSNEVTSSVVEIQSSYVKLLHELNDAKFGLDLAEAEAEAFLTMRKSLENLVELQIMGWNAEREPRPKSQQSRDARDRKSRDASGGIDPND